MGNRFTFVFFESSLRKAMQHEIGAYKALHGTFKLVRRVFMGLGHNKDNADDMAMCFCCSCL